MALLRMGTKRYYILAEAQTGKGGSQSWQLTSAYGARAIWKPLEEVPALWLRLPIPLRPRERPGPQPRPQEAP